MEKIKYENKSYVNGEYVLLNANIYAKGCRSSRDLIKKKNIDNTNYIYARLKENEWIVSDGKSVKLDKVFFSELFIKSIPELNNEKITDGIEQAPDIIILEDDQKIKDDDGNIIEIETRGEKTVDKLYFKVKDVMEGFNMARLDEGIIDKRRINGYKEGEHYVFFNCQNENTKPKKELFLTYHGLMRVFFITRDQRTNENNIVTYITKEFNKYNWLCNKVLNCLYRPDMYTIINEKLILLIEIDEQQHKAYKKIKEDARIRKIYDELNIKNMLVIRINPDSFKNSDNIIHNSINDNNDELSFRLNIIIQTIKNEVIKTHKNINIIKLFYDGYDINKTKPESNNYFNYIKNTKYDVFNKIKSRFIEDSFIFNVGSFSQKQVLFSNVLGIDAKVIKEVFNTDRNSLPCVYLFILNTVGKLRETMKIDEKHADNSIVAKYGFTKDLTRRTNEHISKYNKIPNVDLKLKHYSYIDPQYISNAENDIRDYMNAFKTKFDFDKEDEIVIIPTNFMKIIEKQYELIGKSYMGHISELITKIKDLENKLEKQTLQQQIELQNEIHKNELLNKDLQLSEYKIKFLEMQQKNL